MLDTPDTDESHVLIAGAGPIGLTAAIELSRRGTTCRIVDPLLEAPQYAKAVGVQPRTLEVFEGMGVLRHILDAAIRMHGQIVYVNGEKTAQRDMTLPPDVPFGFIAIPQYATEQILRDELAMRGITVERGVRLTGFEQDADGVTATLAGDTGAQKVRAAFEEQYMVGDVEVDWSVAPGYGVRAMHQTAGKTDDLLVCIPLPGRGRRRAHPPTDRRAGNEHRHPGRPQSGLEAGARGHGACRPRAAGQLRRRAAAGR